MRVRQAVTASIFLCSVLSASLGHAADDRPARRTYEGTVLALDAGDLILDVGSTTGAQVGMSVEVWRPMRVRHPVTGKILVDRFKIGSVRLSEVQNVMSLAKVDVSAFQRQPTPGDVVIVPLPEQPVPTTKPNQARSFDQGGPSLGGALSYAF